MSDSEKDEGIMLVMLNRLNEVRLPRALAIKEQVDRGEPLGDSEIEFLDRVFEEAVANQSRWEKYPEMSEIISKMAGLYKEITEKALANEENSKSS
jgi:hypothetical protein